MNNHALRAVQALRDFTAEMRLINRSEVTITDRLEVLERLRRHLDCDLLDAAFDDLRAFQRQFEHLAPASIDIYTRHVQAFYRWAFARGLIAQDSAATLPRPRVRKGRPHPTSPEDLRVIFACTTGSLRRAYILASFAGLRRGEICRAHRRDMDFGGPTPTALIHGKGDRQRIVPLLPPVIDELASGVGPGGWLVTYEDKPYDPDTLSLHSHRHLHELGIETTLHSMRHAFATMTYRTTKDILLVRDLLGHSSVATSEIYAMPEVGQAHERLSGVTAEAEMLMRPKLRVVGDT